MRTRLGLGLGHDMDMMHLPIYFLSPFSLITQQNNNTAHPHLYRQKTPLLKHTSSQQPHTPQKQKEIVNK